MPIQPRLIFSIRRLRRRPARQSEALSDFSKKTLRQSIRREQDLTDPALRRASQFSPFPPQFPQIAHARFFNLSPLSRRHGASGSAAFARAFRARKRLGVLCLDDSRKISAPGAAKYFDRVRK